MKRTAPVLFALIALVAAPAAHAADPVAKVVLASCTTGLDPAQRTVTYEGKMRRIAGTRKMQMRFALQSRAPGAKRWAGVKGPGLGAWVTSNKGVARYSFSKRIENLGAPAAYRVVVRFRWLDAHNHSLDADQLTAKVCQEPDLRPDLKAKRIDVQRIGDPARRRYVVVVRNDGATAASGFDVGLALPTGALTDQHVVDLGPGASTFVSFDGPRCQAGATLTASVDTGGLVDEADEDDNVLSVPCPQPSA